MNSLLPLLTAVLVAASLLVAPVRAQATFSVNVTADTPDAVINGICDADNTAPGEQCTLRAAIQEAESTFPGDSIHFDIPAAGPHRITVATALPAFLQPIAVDGYTQPGASPNTNGPAQGTNAVILIELDGGDAVADGLVACGGRTTIRGLAIGGFTVNGVVIACNAAGGLGHVVEGCFVGTDASGLVARPNGKGIGGGGSSGNFIGGTTPAARNVLSGNEQEGVFDINSDNTIQGNLIGTDASGTAAIPNGNANNAPGAQSFSGVFGGPSPAERNVVSGNAGRGLVIAGTTIVQGNFIGTDVTGMLPLPNGGDGVLVVGSSNLIGGATPAEGNRIGHSGGAGVSVGFAQSNRIIGNEIFGSGGIGIDIGPLGQTPNDPGDPDAGSNRGQNFPDIAAAGLNGAGELVVTYEVNTDPTNATYPLRIEFFRSDGDGEGEAFLGFDTYAAGDYDGCGTPPCERTVAFMPAAPVAAADSIVATATDDAGNTGEFTAVATVITTPPATDLVLNVDPTSPPVIIPAGGGQFQYTVAITNTTAADMTFDLWSLITGPVTVDPLKGPQLVRVRSGNTLMRTFLQNVPGGAPAGTYTYTMNVGTFPGTVVDSDGFTFEKEAPPLAGRSGAPARAGMETSSAVRSGPLSEAELAEWAIDWDASEWAVIAVVVVDEELAAADKAAADEEAAAAEAPEASVGVESLPTEYALQSAYPNPFTAQATLRYDLPEASSVQVVVYDLLGREVARPVDGEIRAGRHTALLDGRRLASGVYVVRMTTGGALRTRLLTVVR